MKTGWKMQASPGALMLNLHVQPGARKTEIVGLHGASLKIRLAAPPVDGKANDCLIAFLAEQLGVPRAQMELVSGTTSRLKRLRVTGVSEQAVARLVSAVG